MIDLQDVRQVGEAATLLAVRTKFAGAAEISYGLVGRLYISGKGWLLLSVPNALGHGAFQALNEPGVELPVSGTTGRYNAHITVMRPDEVASIGGPDRILERGKEFSFTTNVVRTVQPSSWEDMDRVWFITVRSPDLEKLRKSYGLSPLPNNNEYEFHITFAVRRKNVIRNNPMRMQRAGDLIHQPTSTLSNDKYSRKAAADKSAKAYLVQRSEIEGEGIFANAVFEISDEIGVAMQRLPSGKMQRTELGYKINHSRRPNTILQKDGDNVKLIANEGIRIGDELTCDYKDAYENVLGNDVEFEDGSGRKDNEELLNKDASSNPYLAAMLKAWV